MKKIIEATPLENYNLLIKLDDGTQIQYNVEPLLNTNVFAPLKEKSFFKTVRPTWCGIEWTDEIDICIDSILIDGTKIN